MQEIFPSFVVKVCMKQIILTGIKHITSTFIGRIITEMSLPHFNQCLLRTERTAQETMSSKSGFEDTVSPLHICLEVDMPWIRHVNLAFPNF
jgi:hypothetical protein